MIKPTLTKFVSSIVVIVVLISNLSPNVIYTREQGPDLFTWVRYLFPQGWAFFTKDPREKAYDVVFVHSENGAKSSVDALKPKSLFDRNPRTLETRTSELLAKVNLAEEKWIACGPAPIDVCMEKIVNYEPVFIDKANADRYLCGKQVVAEIQPVDWSYRKIVDRPRVRLIGVEVNCDR